mmetsp:Transcript_27769/g.82881  ORF Transcript_27769/g.82881 Transcript_27769/m.82881 type:complete len:585 (+) Transcript_27769:111-1865(+)
MVAAHVGFRYQGVDWTREFHVEDGVTVRQLKEAMVQPEGGTEADVNSFELRQRGRRVFEFEQIWEDSYFEFMYLGPEEGGKRVARDVNAKESYERAARAEEERKRRAEEDQRRRAEEAERQRQRQAEEERRKEEKRAAKEAAKAPKQVDVTVKHAVEELASQITVNVLSNATVLDVRLAVMAALGESKLSEIKLIKRQGGTLTTLSNETPIGAHREFLSVGRILRSQQEQDSGVEVTFRITSIQDYAEQYVSMSPERTAKDLKVKICEQAQRGSASHVQLWLGEREVRDPEKAGKVFEQCDGNLIVSGITLGPPVPVDVKVTHGSSGHEVWVSLLDTASLRELREAVAGATGGSFADVRIVKRLAGGHFQSLPDSERLNGRAEFLCMGQPAEQPAPVAEDVDLTISICLDSSLGISQDFSVKKWSTIFALKELLAETDPTKRTKPEDFGLSLASAPEVPLVDGTYITEEHLSLNLLAAAGGDAGGTDQSCNISGHWVMTDTQNGDTTRFVFYHEPGREDFTGQQDEWQDLSEGRLYGNTVAFRLGPVRVEGTLNEDGQSMRDVYAKTEDGILISTFTGVFVGPV